MNGRKSKRREQDPAAATSIAQVGNLLISLSKCIIVHSRSLWRNVYLRRQKQWISQRFIQVLIQYVFLPIRVSVNRFNSATGQWKKVTTKDTLPDSRYGHSMVAFENELYMFGGYDHHGFACDDLHVYNFKTAKWTKVVKIDSNSI